MVGGKRCLGFRCCVQDTTVTVIQCVLIGSVEYLVVELLMYTIPAEANRIVTKAPVMRVWLSVIARC